MNEERDQKPAADARRSDTPAATGDSRHTQATSSETLSDLEDKQSPAKTKSGVPDSQRDAPPAPSPDGASVQERGGRADGSDSGGPM